MKIYLDMDGVVADLHSHYELLFGKSWLENEKTLGVEHASKLVHDMGEDFWTSIPVTEDAFNLWDYFKYYDVTFLSAPCNFKEAPRGKRKWLDRYFGNVPAIFENKKWIYSDPKSLLIDDTEININNFIMYGGMGILHVSAKNTISKFEENNVYY
jgi:5'(3')-deoxyribonucleotidase